MTRPINPAPSSNSKKTIRRCGVKVLIAAGGSGGHIFPAVALARALKDKRPDAQIRFVGSNKDLDRRIFEKEGFGFHLLSANKLPYKASFKYITFFIKLKLDIIRSFFIMASYRPNAVVGFGGYISCPVVFCAYILRKPVLMHEQNVIPGRANKLLFRLAKKVALSFKETGRYLSGPESKKCVPTGNPIRNDILRDDRNGGIKKFGLESGKFTILVIGGSQGAHSLNELFIKAISALDKDVRQTLQVIHLTGISDYEWAIEGYRASGVEHRVFSFIDRIEEAYSASDLVVTRSGASAMFELAWFGKPMILVPYRYALGHQSRNAAVFGENKAAIVIDEDKLSADRFKELLSGLLNDRTRLRELAANAKKMSIPDASDRLAGEVLSLPCC